MKSLNLAQPIMMLVVGLPGAGKSFFTKRFSETFGAPVVSVDRIRTELFAQPQFSADENDLIDRLALYQLEELLKVKRTLIIDGGCNAKTDRLRLGQLARKAGYVPLVVWVQTHETTAKGRATKRNPRRVDDQYNVSLSPDLFETFKRKLTPPLTENYVVISGMHTYNTQAKAVLRKLVAGREAEANAAHSSQNKTQLQKTQRPQRNRRSVIIR
jgi:predicted kinase